MEEQIISNLSTVSGAAVVMALWFGRTVYKKFAGHNTIYVIKLINGHYAAKIRRGIGFAWWVRYSSNDNVALRMIGRIVCRTQPNEALNCAKTVLSQYGVSVEDPLTIVETGFTKEEPKL